MMIFGGTLIFSTPEIKADLKDRLKSALSLPLPHSVAGASNGQGVNCFPSDTEPQQVP